MSFSTQLLKWGRNKENFLVWKLPMKWSQAQNWERTLNEYSVSSYLNTFKKMRVRGKCGQDRQPKSTSVLRLIFVCFFLMSSILGITLRKYSVIHPFKYNRHIFSDNAYSISNVFIMPPQTHLWKRWVIRCIHHQPY